MGPWHHARARIGALDSRAGQLNPVGLSARAGPCPLRWSRLARRPGLAVGAVVLPSARGLVPSACVASHGPVSRVSARVSARGLCMPRLDRAGPCRATSGRRSCHRRAGPCLSCSCDSGRAGSACHGARSGGRAVARSGGRAVGRSGGRAVGRSGRPVAHFWSFVISIIDFCKFPIGFSHKKIVALSSQRATVMTEQHYNERNSP